MKIIQKTSTKLLIILSIFVFSGLQTAYAENYPELCSVLNRTLKVGDTGTDVRRLQVVMGQEGIAYLSSTGFYGNATAMAVKTFQVRNGIYPAGKVGPQTLRFMKNLWCFGDGGKSSGPDSTYIPINTNNPELPPQGWNNGGNNWNNGTVPEVSVQPVSSSANNITISWNTRAVNSCSIQQDNNNFQNVQGIGQQIFTLYGESKFTLKCLGNNGREYSKTIVVRPNQSISSLPTVNVSINPSSIIIGQQATLYWTSNNTAYCTSNVPGNTSNLPSSGSIPVTITTGTQSYTFTCYNQMGQSVSQNITANNSQIAVPTINNFTYLNNLLAWGTSNVNSCILSGGNLNNMTVQTSGNYSVTNIPTINTTWTLTCNGNNNQSVTRQVNFNGTNTNTNLSLISNVNGLVNVLIGTPNTGISCVQAINASIVWGDGQTQQFTSCGNTLSHQYINSGTYNIVVNNLSGAQTGSLQVVTNNTANSNITVNISANLNPINPNQSTTLSWSSVNASYCNINGGNLNLINQSTNGTSLVNPTQSTNYTVTCYGSNGQNASTYIYVTVNTPTVNAPTVSVTPNSVNITSGQLVALTFQVANANYCNLNGGIFNSAYYSGNTLGVVLNVNPTQNTTYTATCYGVNGVSVSATATVNINVVNSSVSVAPTSVTITSGASTVLTLTKTNINSCTVTGGIYTNFSMGTLNTITVNPTQSTNYVFNCVSTGDGTVSATTTITVTSTLPELTLNPENRTILWNEPVRINITKQNIASCTIVGGVYITATNIGAIDSIVVIPTQTTTYTFSCLGNNNTTVTKSSIITVNSTPSVSVSANNTTIVSGFNTTLTLTKVNIASCTISGGGYSATALAATTTMTVAPTTTTTYTFNCTGVNAGTANTSILITVVSAPNITVTPYTQTISNGQVVAFILNKTNISTCSINNVNIGGLNVWNVAPTTTTTYNFNCIGTTGINVATSSLIIVQ